MSMGERLIKQYDVQEMPIAQLHERIRLDFHDCPLRTRPAFRLVSEYVKWLLEGKKCTTIRYRPNAIDVPAALELPLIESSNRDNSHTQHHSASYRQVAAVGITGIVIKPFATLDDHDARRDGFSTKDELKEALQRLYSPVYGPVDGDQYVSIYRIALIERGQQ